PLGLEGGGLGGDGPLLVAEGPALGHLRLGGAGVALPPQPADLLRQRLDLGPQLVALGGQGPLALVELDDPVEGVGRVAAPPGRQCADRVGFVADPSQVEHGRDGSGASRAAADLDVGTRPPTGRVGSVGAVAAVEVDELTVRYGDVVAVDGASFVAEAGRITAVLGPNGAGKTTTVETLEGYRRPTAGRVRVLGLDPVADHRALTERIGVMLQSGGVGPGVRAGEALRHAAALYPQPLPTGPLLERVGLAGKERRTWRQLSGGGQRRLALALALVGRPQVAFLDEPSSGVDPQGRLAIREVVAGLRDDGVTVVLTTHDLDEAERLADHVVILDRGRVVAAGTPDEL